MTSLARILFGTTIPLIAGVAVLVLFYRPAEPPRKKHDGFKVLVSAVVDSVAPSERRLGLRDISDGRPACEIKLPPGMVIRDCDLGRVDLDSLRPGQFVTIGFTDSIENVDFIDRTARRRGDPEPTP